MSASLLEAVGCEVVQPAAVGPPTAVLACLVFQSPHQKLVATHLAFDEVGTERRLLKNVRQVCDDPPSHPLPNFPCCRGAPSRHPEGPCRHAYCSVDVEICPPSVSSHVGAPVRAARCVTRCSLRTRSHRVEASGALSRTRELKTASHATCVDELVRSTLLEWNHVRNGEVPPLSRARSAGGGLERGAWLASIHGACFDATSPHKLSGVDAEEHPQR
mmetsp:Transcript_759/g.2137  ORF Transcript_759/g.2137 Transcript_759/m.2137 type:complete len:217 (+) Transcript_759:645-1295(+)